MEIDLESRLFSKETKGKKRAILFTGGGPKTGAFQAGVSLELLKVLGPNFFNHGYAVSVGAYQAAYFLANQGNTLQAIYREIIPNSGLLNIFNFFKDVSKHYLDSEMLTKLFKESDYKLNTDAVLSNDVPMDFALTNVKTGKTKYVRPKTVDEIFEGQEASASFPIRDPIQMGENKGTFKGGEFYTDGGLSCGFPIEKALADGNEEILIIDASDYSELYKPGADKKLNLPAFLCENILGNRKMANLIRGYHDKLRAVDKIVKQNKNKINVIKPSAKIMKHAFDMDSERMNAMVTEGQEQGRAWLRSVGYQIPLEAAQPVNRFGQTYNMSMKLLKEKNTYALEQVSKTFSDLLMLSNLIFNFFIN